jgi:Ca-activated chloride channel family protein
MRIILSLSLVFTIMTASAQSADQAFHMASGQYIHGKMPEAKTTLDNALQKYPTDKKLNALREMIKEEQQDQKNKDKNEENKENKEQKDEGKDKKEQDQKNKENKDQEGKKEDQKSQEQKDKEQQQKQEQQKKEQEADSKESEEGQKKEDQSPSFSEKLEQMKISEETAKMILEAMKNQEMQYLQQQKRKTTKPRDKSKPDW